MTFCISLRLILSSTLYNTIPVHRFIIGENYERRVLKLDSAHFRMQSREELPTAKSGAFQKLQQNFSMSFFKVKARLLNVFIVFLSYTNRITLCVQHLYNSSSLNFFSELLFFSFIFYSFPNDLTLVLVYQYPVTWFIPPKAHDTVNRGT